MKPPQVGQPTVHGAPPFHCFSALRRDMKAPAENVGQDTISSDVFSLVPGEFCELVNGPYENVDVFETHSVSKLNR
jgi:hypothetical protein